MVIIRVIGKGNSCDPECCAALAEAIQRDIKYEQQLTADKKRIRELELKENDLQAKLIRHEERAHKQFIYLETELKKAKAECEASEEIAAEERAKLAELRERFDEQWNLRVEALEKLAAALDLNHPECRIRFHEDAERISKLEAENERAQAACHKEHLEKVALEAEVAEKGRALAETEKARRALYEEVARLKAAACEWEGGCADYSPPKPSRPDATLTSGSVEAMYHEPPPDENSVLARNGRLADQDKMTVCPYKAPKTECKVLTEAQKQDTKRCIDCMKNCPGCAKLAAVERDREELSGAVLGANARIERLEEKLAAAEKRAHGVCSGCPDVKIKDDAIKRITELTKERDNLNLQVLALKDQYHNRTTALEDETRRLNKRICTECIAERAIAYPLNCSVCSFKPQWATYKNTNEARDYYNKSSGDGKGGPASSGEPGEACGVTPIAGSPRAPPTSPEGPEMIAWCEEHGRETVTKIMFGHISSEHSGFRLTFKCGRKDWYSFPFVLNPIFSRPSGGETAGNGAQGEPATPHTTVVLGLETPASFPPEGMTRESIEEIKRYADKSEGEFTCDGCGKHMDCIAVQIDFGFGSTHDEERLEFCSDECFSNWLDREW